MTDSTDSTESTSLPRDAQAMALGRIALAMACFTVPGLVLRVLGFKDRSRGAKAFATMLGTRDLGMALCLWAAAEDPVALAKVEQVCGMIDMNDALALGMAGLRDKDMRRAALINVPFATVSAIVSFSAAKAARART